MTYYVDAISPEEARILQEDFARWVQEVSDASEEDLALYNLSRGQASSVEFSVLEAGLRKALSEGSFTHAGVRFTRQDPNGKSIWAKAVRMGKLRPNQVAWAFVPGKKPVWLGFMTRGKGKSWSYDLRTRFGRKGLSRLEARVRAVLGGGR